MSPERVFQLLLTGGLLLGGWFYGDYYKRTAPTEANQEVEANLRAENTELTLELDSLRDEVAQLRSLLKSGPYPIPEDLIEFVEKDNGLQFQLPPLAQLTSPAEMRNAAERNIELVYGKDGLEKEQRAWELIGLTPPDQRLRAQWIAIETMDAKGLFDLSAEKILLAENFDPMSISDSGMLVHLLTRQLIFQNYPQKSWPNSEAFRAWQGTHRGAAASVQSRYLRRRAATEEVEWNPGGETREALLNSLSPTIQGLANFPFLEGHDYAKVAYLKSRDDYRAIFEQPAHTTARLLYPEASDTGILQSALTPTNEVGALAFSLLLDPYLGNETSNELTLLFKGDYYVLSEKSLIWTIEMSTPEAALQLRDTLLQIEGASGKEKRQATLQGTTVTLTVTP
ncbi:MAG: hypothetical protein ACN4GG_01070 [Akkermansiaceae bacterium]